MEGAGLISFVWVTLLRSRSVHIGADETICGAILMNLDLTKLLAAMESDRVKTFGILLGEGFPLLFSLFRG